LFDHAFDVRAYSWLGIWYVCFTAYEVVVKHMCDTVAVDNWTRVVYTNAMAGSLLAVAIPFVKGEHAAVAALPWNATATATLLASCLIGIGVSHSAYVMRSACSATLSAVVGILCKVLTVLINILLWDKHASVGELRFLALGLMAGAFYEQAPLRKGPGDGGGTNKFILTGSRTHGDDPVTHAEEKNILLVAGSTRESTEFRGLHRNIEKNLS
jgi:GDP-mannose transporter